MGRLAELLQLLKVRQRAESVQTEVDRWDNEGGASTVSGLDESDRSRGPAPSGGLRAGR